MNIVLITPVAATPDLDLLNLANPRVPSLVGDPRQLQETNIVELGKAFADLGHPTTIMLGDLFLDGQSKTFSDRLRVVPARTIMRVPFHPGLFPLTPSLIRHQALRDADVIQSGNFHQPSTFFAGIAAREAEAPIVVWQETFEPMRPPGSWYQLAYEAVAGNRVRGATKRFVPRTTEAHTYLRRLGVRETAISSWIPTGIDLRTYTPKGNGYSPKEFGWTEEARILLMVARLHHSKGVDVALRVMKRVLRKDPNVRLIVRGAGPELASLRQLATRLQIDETVRIIGRLPREDLIRLYRTADIVLCASRTDLLPFALIEASACGRPVVATNVGAIRDIVVPEVTGVMAERGDVEGLGKAILTLLQDDELRSRLGSKARKRMEDHFDMDRVAKRLLEVYRGVTQ